MNNSPNIESFHDLSSQMTLLSQERNVQIGDFVNVTVYGDYPLTYYIRKIDNRGIHISLSINETEGLVIFYNKESLWKIYLLDSQHEIEFKANTLYEKYITGIADIDLQIMLAQKIKNSIESSSSY